jgi:hypothetical protein
MARLHRNIRWEKNMLNLHKFIVPSALILSAWLIPLAQAAGVRDGVAKQPAKQPAVTSGDCKVKKVAFVTDDTTGATTNSTSYVNVPNAAVAFSQGGNTTQCIVVNFSAWAFAPNALLDVRAQLDGVDMAPGGDQQFAAKDDTFAFSHAFSWAANATPGAHTVQIQFKSFDGAGVFIHKHTTSVHHL